MRCANYFFKKEQSFAFVLALIYERAYIAPHETGTERAWSGVPCGDGGARNGFN